MTLQRGTRLGVYVIDSPLGAGGMGEVYRAKDTRLDRDVAIKVLPEAWRQDKERLLRLEREAKVLASLNHPNIASVYGFEEDQNQPFLVMELAEGETLADRLRRGPLPVRDVLEIAALIARALDEAHQRGIVHRDLKPANVKVSADGTVKVLDFGLAKALTAEPATTDPTNSPTISVEYTRPGVVLGTAAYMSPEQARGKPIDKRTDIWSFGVVLYECLGGRRPFNGETTSDLIARILERDPDWNALPPTTSHRLRTILRRCLTKNRGKRLRDIGDARIELEELLDHPQADDHRPPPPSGGPMARCAWPAVSLLLLAALATTLIRSMGVADPRQQSSPRPKPVVTEMAQLTDAPGMQISPDLDPSGRTLLYVARDGVDLDIFLQRVGGENAINLTADCTADDYDPEFSPDGERIAFRSEREGGGLFIMGATGESPRRVSNDGFDPSWSPDGRSLVFTTEDAEGPYSRATVAQLWLVDVRSGEKKLLTQGDGVAPVFSPSGKRVAYWASIAGIRDIFTISIEGGDPQPVTQDAATDWSPFFAPDGETLFFISDRSGTPDLWRVAVNEQTGAVLGEPHPVTASAATMDEATITADGRHVVFTAPMSIGEIQRYAFDAQGERVLGEPKSIFASTNVLYQFDVTRDGHRLVYRTGAPREDLVVMNTDGTGRRRITDDVFRDRGPKWYPDGSLLLFYSNRGASYNAWRIRPDGTDARPLTNSGGVDLLDAIVSADGRRFAGSLSLAAEQAVALYELDRPLAALNEPLPEPTATVTGLQANAFSPDGRYLAGTVSESLSYAGVGIISTETMDLIRIKAPDGGDILTSQNSGMDWIDNNRLIVWDEMRNTTFVYHLDSDQTREMTGLQGPCDIRVVENGAALIVNRTREEADIWMLTLDTIDDSRQKGP